MTLVVRVPVLSEQMLVHPPIVSHAAITRTRFLSFCIFLTEYARAMVTASGKPSGTGRKKKSQWSMASGKPSGTATQNILKIYCPSTIKR
jgi:hypothetical protein